jgi:ABC-type nitrate/sulfonate/bicarbonate transport system substrate-binding protein
MSPRTLLLAGIALLGACSTTTEAPPPEAPPAPEPQAPAVAKVSMAVPPALSSAGILIAVERGYFEEQGIEVDTASLEASGAAMLPSLAAGELDVGAGEIGVELYRALADGQGLRIVADKGSVTQQPDQQAQGSTAGDDQAQELHQRGAILFSQAFISERPDVAQAWMTAYLRGLRDYNDAFVHEHRQDETVQLLSEALGIEGAALLASATPLGLQPDGSLHTQAMADEVQRLLERGQLEVPVDLSLVVDSSFVEQANKALGPYIAPKQAEPEKPKSKRVHNPGGMRPGGGKPGMGPRFRDGGKGRKAR